MHLLGCVFRCQRGQSRAFRAGRAMTKANARATFIQKSERHRFAAQWMADRVDLRGNGVLCDGVVDRFLGDRSSVRPTH